MRLDGIHHITAITGDAPRNVDFYTRVLGLRMTAKTVNQDDPSVYHLFYGDENARPGADLTFFEYPGASPGRPGAGMVHRVVWRVGTPAALDFWAARLADEDVDATRPEDGASLRFADPEGLSHELVVIERGRPAADRRASRGTGGARAAGLRGRARLQLRSGRQRRDARAPDGRRAHRRRGSLGAARPGTRRLDRVRPGTGSARAPERRRRAPRRLRHHRCGAAGLDRRRDRRRRAEQRLCRPPLLPFAVLPRAGRRAVRARDG